MNGWLALAIWALMIVLNGLFVAAEFSLVSTRRGRIADQAEQGDRRARRTLEQVDDLPFVLSSAQFGITTTSLLVGFLAGPAVGETVIRPVLQVVGLGPDEGAGLSLTAAIMISTVVQMLVGELAPKNYAIARPEATALAVATPMRVFESVFGPVVRIFDSAAQVISERAFGIEVDADHLAGYSLEELARIITASEKQGSLSRQQAELLARAVEFGSTRVSHIMVPRPSVLWLQGDAPVSALQELARRTGHSRYPVIGEGEDEILGTVHIKDLLSVPREKRSSTRIIDIASEPIFVPSSETVRRLFREFRERHATFAVVFDEYGGTAGIVTIEDVFEALVGEIEDEFDETDDGVERIQPDLYEVDGSLRLDRAARTLDLHLPEGDYETVAGYLMERLGRIPGEGDQVEFEGWRLTVADMDDVRVLRVSVQAPQRTAAE